MYTIYIVKVVTKHNLNTRMSETPCANIESVETALRNKLKLAGQESYVNEIISRFNSSIEHIKIHMNKYTKIIELNDKDNSIEILIKQTEVNGE